jgi:hypothetical protein
MSDLNIDHNQKEIIIQPQFSRHHHAFRSPMGSEILNLEMSQFRFDITKIYRTFSDITKKLQEKMNFLYNNTSNLEDATASKVKNSIATTTAFHIESIESIVNKLEKLKYRLDILERGF